MERAIIIFVRNPEAGKVKTRLAATVGNEAALFIYKKLLTHTLEITETMAADKFIFYADEVATNDIWQRPGFFKSKQASGDLGHRMCSAFIEVLSKGYHSVCIIGSDCYELSTVIIEQAFDLLRVNDVVIGPAKDGGYYLLGMKELYPKLFEEKIWSTGTVYDDTVSTIHQSGLAYKSLETLTDIDEEKDLPAKWKNELGMRDQ